MSRYLDGLSLQTEFSELLSDTTTAFKARTLKWMNDIQTHICAYHDWDFLKRKGKKVLTADTEIQSLNLATPGAPTVALATGGSLTEGSVYTVRVTYYEGVSGAESLAGTVSSSLTATATDKQIDLTAIPTSSDPLVTARRIYLDTDSGGYFLYSTISDNTTTTASITAETTSTVQSPDIGYIDQIIGAPFFESAPSVRVAYRPIDQLRLLFEGSWTSGSPTYYYPMGEEKVIFYPPPSTAITASFYYRIVPPRIYAEATSFLTIPPKLKEALEAGVKWKGMRYRDRDGEVSARLEYFEILKDSVSRFGSSNKKLATVRDVTGTTDGWVLGSV